MPFSSHVFYIALGDVLKLGALMRARALQPSWVLTRILLLGYDFDIYYSLHSPQLRCGPSHNTNHYIFIFSPKRSIGVYASWKQGRPKKND